MTYGNVLVPLEKDTIWKSQLLPLVAWRKGDRKGLDL